MEIRENPTFFLLPRNLEIWPWKCFCLPLGTLRFFLISFYSGLFSRSWVVFLPRDSLVSLFKAPACSLCCCVEAVLHTGQEGAESFQCRHLILKSTLLLTGFTIMDNKLFYVTEPQLPVVANRNIN